MSIQANVDLHFWITRAMARRMGVNLTEAVHDGFLTQADVAEMITRCSECAGTQGCMAYLAGPREGRGSAPDWCRNASVLNSLSELV